eukprot:1591017-Amphidinium_carterae.1
MGTCAKQTNSFDCGVYVLVLQPAASIQQDKAFDSRAVLRFFLQQECAASARWIRRQLLLSCVLVRAAIGGSRPVHSPLGMPRSTRLLMAILFTTRMALIPRRRFFQPALPHPKDACHTEKLAMTQDI